MVFGKKYENPYSFTKYSGIKLEPEALRNTNGIVVELVIGYTNILYKTFNLYHINMNKTFFFFIQTL